MYIAAVPVVLLIIIYIYFFNKLVNAKQNVKEAWSDIDVQLKRRHNLIPNLVSIVKQYAKYEKNLLEEIAKLRAQALSLGTNDIKGKAEVEANLGKALKSIIAWAESYPDLKANQNFLKLQEELTETEDQIASARRIYNSNVADYNSLIGMFPSNIIAKSSNFTPAPFFQNN